MILSKVIETLQKTLDEKGDIVVLVNGEHGESEPELAKEEHFAVGEADLTLGGDRDNLPYGIKKRQIIMQIGGY